MMDNTPPQSPINWIEVYSNYFNPQANTIKHPEPTTPTQINPTIPTDSTILTITNRFTMTMISLIAVLVASRWQ